MVHYGKTPQKRSFVKNGLQILLVEDNPGDAILIKEALRESVYRDAQLVTAACLSDALSYANQTFLLVLLDLGLPDSEGLETVRKINQYFKDGVLIVLTGLDDEKVAVETLREGAQNYLNKNEIDFKILERTIRFSLERHRIIQQLKSVDKQLLESKYFLEQAQAIAQIGSWVYDIKNDHLEWSAGIYKIFGLGTELKASTELFYSLVYNEDLETLKINEEKVITGIEPDSMYFRFVRQNDQAIRHALSEYRYETNEHGERLKVFGIVKDITMQKKAEEEREKFIKEIVQRHKDLEQFTYIVSHNLRLPVANILGFAEILKMEGITASEREEFIELIINSVFKLDEVVKDLNQVLQIRQAIHEKKELVVLEQVVLDILESIRQILQSENVAIHMDFAKAPALFSIKSYLYSILYNLISNSLKYRQRDLQPIIHVHSEIQNDLFRIIYKDNGTGIDMSKYRQDVFGLYKRFHSKVEGKGLGLYMVKTQVESLGGKISLSSEPNKGVVFTLEFEWTI